MEESSEFSLAVQVDLTDGTEDADAVIFAIKIPRNRPADSRFIILNQGEVGAVKTKFAKVKKTSSKEEHNQALENLIDEFEAESEPPGQAHRPN